MSLFTKTTTTLVCALLILFFAKPLVAQELDRKARTVDDLRQAYTVLKRQGLIEMRANVIPVWDHLTRELTAQQTVRVLELATRLSFSVSVDSSGVIKVTHQVAGPPPDTATARSLEELATGVESTVRGFFMSWTPFMLSELLPKNPDSLVLQELPTGYRLTYKEGAADVYVMVSKDLEITELKTPTGTLKPTYIRTDKGYLLTSYEGDTQDSSFGRINLKTTILYEEIKGMQLPRNVMIDGTVKGSPVRFELGFTKYELKTTTGG